MKINKLFWILSIILLLSVGFVSADVPPTGGVSYFDFETGSGTTVIDNWVLHNGSANSMTWSSSVPTFNNTGDGGSYSGSFSGSTGSYVNFGDNADYDITGDLSISAWVYGTSMTETSKYYNAIAKGSIYQTGYGIEWYPSKKEIEMWVRSSSGVCVGSMDVAFADTSDFLDKWWSIIGVYDSTAETVTIYVNGTKQSSSDCSGGKYPEANSDFLSVGKASGTGAGNLPWNGKVDEFKLFNIALTDTQAYNLFNDGDVRGGVPPFSVSASNFWNSSSINTFWATINGTNYTTSNGTITTTLLRNDTSTYNLQVGASNYFTETYADYNIRVNKNAFLHQSEINFSVLEYITNNTIVGGTCTVDTVSKPCSDLFYLNNGTKSVTFNKTGYIDKTTSFNVTSLDNKTVDIVDVFGLLINITPKNILTNGSLSNFTGWLYDINNSINMSFSTTDSSYSFPGVTGSSYLLSVSPDGYATTTINFTPDSTYYNISTYHYTFNSIRINIYNDTSSNLLTQLVTINSIWDVNSAINTTSNGSIIIDFLDPNSYELRFVSVNHLNTSIFLTITNDSTQEVNIYLPLASGKELQRFLVVDQIGDVLPSAIIRLQQEVIGFDGLYQTVDEKSTNTDGETGFYVDKSTNIFYRMIVVYDNVVKLITDKTLFLPSVDEIISLQIDTSGAEEDSVDNVVSTFVWSGELNNTFTFSWVDPDNSIVGGWLFITVEDFNLTGVPPSTLYDNYIFGSTGSLTYTLPVVNDTRYVINSYIIWNSYDELVDNSVKIFGLTIVPDKDLGLLLAAIVFVFVAFITISLKPLFSSLLSFGVLAILNGFKLISIGTTVITSFIALAIIFFIKIKGGGQ